MKTIEISDHLGNTAEVQTVHFTTGPQIVLNVDADTPGTATMFLSLQAAEELAAALLNHVAEARTPPTIIEA